MHENSMREYVDTQQKPLSRTITASPQKRGKATIQAALDDKKPKKIGIEEVQNVFTELISIMGCGNWDMQQYVRTTLRMSLTDFQKQIRDRYSGLSITLRALGEGIVEIPEVKEMYHALKKGDDSLSNSDNVLMDFMKNMRYSHYTEPDKTVRIFQNGLDPSQGGKGMSQKINSGSLTAESRVRWSRGYSFVTRNNRDRSDYFQGRQELDVFVPQKDMLMIDLDSYGFKSAQVLNWIGDKKNLNEHAAVGIGEKFGTEHKTGPVDPNAVNDMYHQICGVPVSPTRVIPAPLPALESDPAALSVPKAPESVKKAV